MQNHAISRLLQRRLDLSYSGCVKAPYCGTDTPAKRYIFASRHTQLPKSLATTATCQSWPRQLHARASCRAWSSRVLEQALASSFFRCRLGLEVFEARMSSRRSLGLCGVVTIVDKSELKEIGAVGVMASASLTSPRAMTSGFPSDRCTRVHSARADPNFPLGGERRPGAAPRGIRWVSSSAE